jgi:hypothetical protein
VSDQRKKVLAELLSPAQLAQVSQQFMVIIASTFIEDQTRLVVRPTAVRPPTRPEIKRRTEILYKWFTVMRADLGFSTHRALDMLPEALRTELDGGSWEPPHVDRGWGAKERTSVGN